MAARNPFLGPMFILLPICGAGDVVVSLATRSAWGAMVMLPWSIVWIQFVLWSVTHDGD
jgi:hypothetical protein